MTRRHYTYDAETEETYCEPEPGPQCDQCLREIFDDELNNHAYDEPECYCFECWQNLPTCYQCEERITTAHASEVIEGHPVHITCVEEWHACKAAEETQ